METSVVNAILMRKSSIVISCGGIWGGGLTPPQIIVINLFVPTQHPIFTPGPVNK